MDNHQKILSFIKAVRESFPDAAIIYKYGGCYGLYKILKKVFPNAIPYKEDDQGHIVARISGRFYDIEGECINGNAEPSGKFIKLNTKQKEYWETVSCSQRVEYMLRKYNEDCIPRKP